MSKIPILFFLKIRITITLLFLSLFAKASFDELPGRILSASTDGAVQLERDDFLVYEDSSSVLTFEQAKGLISSNELPLIKENSIPRPESAYWVVIAYEIWGEDVHWVLEALDHHIEEFSVYSPQGRLLMGSSQPFANRQYKVKNFVIDAQPTPQGLKGSYFVIRMKASTKVGFEFVFKKTSFFAEYSSLEYYFLGLYYGVLLIMALYNLLLFFSSKERVYLLYILYVFACILVSFEEDGVGFQLLWGNAPGFNYALSHYVAPFLFMASFVGYSVTFLSLPTKHNKLYKLVLLTGSVYVLAQLINVLFIPGHVVVQDFYFVPFLLVFVVAIKLYKQGYEYSRYFILGNAFVFVSIVVSYLRAHFFIPANVFTVYSFNFGVLFEVVVLSFALGDRIRTLKKEKENSQRIIINQLNENKELQHKVNRELEEKVQERTSELKAKTDEVTQANTELQSLRDQLLVMNEQLDKENWKLAKDVKEHSFSRLFDPGLSHDQFVNLFPDDFSCLKHLEKLKWGESYRCSKCGHENFSKQQKLLTRKCSSCGNEESVIANSLFHGVRFAPREAFFLAYIESTSTKVTSEELTKVMGVHRNTVSKFRSKVRDWMEGKEVDRGQEWGSVFVGLNS